MKSILETGKKYRTDAEKSSGLIILLVLKEEKKKDPKRDLGHHIVMSLAVHYGPQVNSNWYISIRSAIKFIPLLKHFRSRLFKITLV